MREDIYQLNTEIINELWFGSYYQLTNIEINVAITSSYHFISILTEGGLQKQKKHHSRCYVTEVKRTTTFQTVSPGAGRWTPEGMDRYNSIALKNNLKSTRGHITVSKIKDRWLELRRRRISKVILMMKGSKEGGYNWFILFVRWLIV